MKNKTMRRVGWILAIFSLLTGLDIIYIGTDDIAYPWALVIVIIGLFAIGIKMIKTFYE